MKLDPPLALGRLLFVAGALTAMHVAVIGEYGIFRDELYYIACGKRLAWGYVDHPPLVAVMAWASRRLFGESVAGLRILPIGLGAVLVLLTGALARRFGGGAFAQTLAGLAVAVAPQYLFVFHIMSMNSTEIVLWTAAMYLMVVVFQTGRRWPWAAFGVVAGLGLLNKHSMLLAGLGILVGLILSARPLLRTRWPWIAGGMAAAIFLPHVAWQVRHDWPTLEFVRNAQAIKIAPVSFVEFLGAQVQLMNPVTAPIWIGGLWFFARAKERAEYRVFAWTFLVVLAILVLDRSKPYYLTPIYPALFAGGARWIDSVMPPVRVARGAMLSLVVACGLALAPLALPILPVSLLVAYLPVLGITPSSGERHEPGALPQHYADMHGWNNLAEAVSFVYRGLADEEREGARVFAQNYGEAGALELYESRYALPPVISPHNNYWLWGPGPDGGTLIVVGGDREDVEAVFERVDLAGRTSCRECMPYERDLPIYVGRGWKVPIGVAWARARRFN